jgi:hypothetical protein
MSDPTELYMVFHVGHCNGSMSLKILCNDEIIDEFDQIEQKYLIVNKQIKLPCTLTFVTGNKNPATDTLVDADGNITEDKFIEVTDLRLGRIPLDPYQFFKGKSYWGFPGATTLEFQEPNFLLWHLKNNT